MAASVLSVEVIPAYPAVIKTEAGSHTGAGGMETTMNDRRYLLSIKELVDGGLPEQDLERAYLLLDSGRQKKLEAIGQEHRRMESLGAGLLLQLGIQETDHAGGNGQGEELHFFTVSQILKRLSGPAEWEYAYSATGKPCFRDKSVCFNLSHSGEYVFCVFSGEEVGVDIQQQKPLASEKVMKRFFTREEQDFCMQYAAPWERERAFYRIWTRKEAYGKLTGEGIAGTIAQEVSGGRTEEKNTICRDGLSYSVGFTTDRALGVCWEEYEIPGGYHIAVCKRLETAGDRECSSKSFEKEE